MAKAPMCIMTKAQLKISRDWAEKWKRAVAKEKRLNHRYQSAGRKALFATLLAEAAEEDHEDALLQLELLTKEMQENPDIKFMGAETLAHETERV